MVKRLMLGLSVVAASGCSPEWFSDDIDTIFDFAVLLSPLRSRADMLQTPYVRGAQVSIHANTTRERSREDWTLEVADPAIFAVDDTEYRESSNSLTIRGRAARVGTTDVLLVDDRGRVRSRAPIEVALPDRAELHGAAALFVGHPDLDPLTEAPKVLVDGLATYQVRYFAGGRRVHGNGVLTVDPPAGLDATTARTHLFETREWLRLAPIEAGAHALDLRVDGELVSTVEVTGVTKDTIAFVDLFGRSERGAEEEDWLVIAAQAYDTPGDPVHGVEFAWEVHGFPQAGEGDLYRYQYDPEGETTVLADFDGHVAEATIFAGDGYVDSSNRIGCDTSGGALGWAPVLALLAVGRRRPRPDQRAAAVVVSRSRSAA